MTAARITSADMRRITITLTVPRIVRFRFWLGLKIVALGFRVTAMSLDIRKVETTGPA